MRTTSCSKVAWHGVHGRLASTSLADPSPKMIASTRHHMNSSRKNPGPPGAGTPARIWSSRRHPGMTAAHGCPIQRQGRLGARTRAFVPIRRRLMTSSGRPRLHAPCTPRLCLGRTPPRKRMRIPPTSTARCDSSLKAFPFQLPVTYTKVASSCAPQSPPRCTRHSRVPWRTRLFSSQARCRFLNRPTRHQLRLKWGSAAFTKTKSTSATR